MECEVAAVADPNGDRDAPDRPNLRPAIMSSNSGLSQY